MNHQTNFVALKRLLSIFFLTIFLFNVGGYYFVFWGLQYQTNRIVERQLDNNSYEGSSEITLSIPLSLPYPIYEEGFSRVHGNFEYDGVHYKLVKQKIKDDRLIVVCIKDEKSTELSKELLSLEKSAHDHKSSKRALSLLAKLIKEFSGESSIPYGFTIGWARDIYNTQFTFSYNTASPPINTPPPRIS